MTNNATPGIPPATDTDKDRFDSGTSTPVTDDSRFTIKRTIGPHNNDIKALLQGFFILQK